MLNKLQDPCTRRLRQVNAGQLLVALALIAVPVFSLWDSGMSFYVFSTGTYSPSFIAGCTLPAASAIGFAMYTLMVGDWMLGAFLTSFSAIYGVVTISFELNWYCLAGTLCAPFNSYPLVNGTVAGYRESFIGPNPQVLNGAQSLVTSRIVFLFLLVTLVAAGALLFTFMLVATNVPISRPWIPLRYAPRAYASNNRMPLGPDRSTMYQGPCVDYPETCWNKYTKRIEEATPAFFLTIKTLAAFGVVISGWVIAGFGVGGAGNTQAYPTLVWVNAYESPFFVLCLVSAALIFDLDSFGSDTSFFHGRKGRWYVWFWIWLTYGFAQAGVGFYSSVQTQHENGVFTLLDTQCYGVSSCYKALWLAGQTFYDLTGRFVDPLTAYPRYVALGSSSAVQTQDAENFAANTVAIAAAQQAIVVFGGILWVFQTAWVFWLGCTRDRSVWTTNVTLNQEWKEYQPGE